MVRQRRSDPSTEFDRGGDLHAVLKTKCSIELETTKHVLPTHHYGGTPCGEDKAPIVKALFLSKDTVDSHIDIENDEQCQGKKNTSGLPFARFPRRSSTLRLRVRGKTSYAHLVCYDRAHNIPYPVGMMSLPFV